MQSTSSERSSLFLSLSVETDGGFPPKARRRSRELTKTSPLSFFQKQMGRQGWKEVAAAWPFTLKVEGGTSRSALSGKTFHRDSVQSVWASLMMSLRHFFFSPHESLFPKADKAGFDDSGAHFL